MGTAPVVAAAKPVSNTGAGDIPVLFDYPRTPAKDDILFSIARVLKQHMDASAAAAPTTENVIVDINRGTDENTEPTSKQSSDAAQKAGLGFSRNGRRESMSVFN